MNNDAQWQVLVLLVRKIAEEKKMTHEQIAEKAGLQRQTVGRIFSLKFSPQLRVFVRVADAVGCRFFLQDRESNSDLNRLMNEAMDELGGGLNISNN